MNKEKFRSIVETLYWDIINDFDMDRTEEQIKYYMEFLQEKFDIEVDN